MNGDTIPLAVTREQVPGVRSLGPDRVIDYPQTAVSDASCRYDLIVDQIAT